MGVGLMESISCFCSQCPPFDLLSVVCPVPPLFLTRVPFVLFCFFRSEEYLAHGGHAKAMLQFMSQFAKEMELDGTVHHTVHVHVHMCERERERERERELLKRGREGGREGGEGREGAPLCKAGVSHAGMGSK